MQKLSIALGKTIFALLRLMGRTGSALPGLVVEKFNRGFLYHQLAQLPQGVIIISGTNGKTTTTKLTAALLESQGLRVLTNPTGSNFVRGIISVVVDKTKWSGALPYDIAVFEQDEAHAVKLAELVHPRGVVVLNIMRDQMDRFGEIDTTRQMLQKLVAVAREWVVLNANDERVSQLKPAEGVDAVWYAHSKELQADFLTDDQLYHAESTAYHLAGAPSVELKAYQPGAVTIARGKLMNYAYALQGGHNALNLTAALATIYTAMADVNETALTEAVAAVQPAFGRGEVITLPSGGKLTLQLIKNPGGFTQALRMTQLKSYDMVAIAINDDYPDGRDVSWLWDVNFTGIADGPAVYCGGVRAADMANRLKYDEVQVAGVEPDIHSYGAQLDSVVPEGQEGILFCTYTAMLKLRGQYLGSISGLEEASDV